MRLRRLIASALVVASCAVLIAACGSQNSESSQPKATRTLSDEDKVQLAVADFYGGRAKAVCKSLSSDVLAQVGGRKGCETAAARQKPVRYNVQSVRFGTTGEATAVVRSGGKVIQLSLVDQSGDWKISQPLPSFARSAAG